MVYSETVNLGLPQAGWSVRGTVAEAIAGPLLEEEEAGWLGQAYAMHSERLDGAW